MRVIDELRGELPHVGPTTKAVILAAIAELEAVALPEGQRIEMDPQPTPGNPTITVDREWFFRAMQIGVPFNAPAALPEGHTLLKGHVWRVDLAVNADKELIIEATDAEHGVLARLVPVTPTPDEEGS